MLQIIQLVLALFFVKRKPEPLKEPKKKTLQELFPVPTITSLEILEYNILSLENDIVGAISANYPPMVVELMESRLTYYYKYMKLHYPEAIT